MYEVKFGTDKGKQLHLDKANRDIALMVNLCSKEDYGIKVYYWKGPPFTIAAQMVPANNGSSE